MMRVTIIPEDGFVAIDGDGYRNLALSFIPNEVHALQWYGDDGEIEHQDARGRATYNQKINSLSEFSYFDQCYQLWEEAKAKAKEKEEAEAALDLNTIQPEDPTP